MQDVIRDMDMTGTTNQLADFLMGCSYIGVVVQFDEAKGPNGYPVATFKSNDSLALKEAIKFYCGFDEEWVEAYMEEVETWTWQGWQKINKN
jgi:selenocysteine lyase/cysteine desulfurase